MCVYSEINPQILSVWHELTNTASSCKVGWFTPPPCKSFLFLSILLTASSKFKEKQKNELKSATCGNMTPSQNAYRLISSLFIFQRFLGDITHSLLTGDEAEAAICRFQASLQEISDSIKVRNESLELPYINLLPERIPDSIAI